MCEKIKTRYVTLLNLALLFINGLFLVIIIISWLIPAVRAVKRSFKLEHDLGMKTYVIKQPFSILVNRSFPDKAEFKLIENGAPYFFSVKNVEGKEKRRNAELIVGKFTASCIFSQDDKIEIYEYSVTNGSESFIDLNADGKFDVRISCYPERRKDIWLNGKWVAVVLGGNRGKYNNKLLSGVSYYFDIAKGEWLPQETVETGVGSNNSTGGK